MQPSPTSPVLHNLPNLLLVMEARGIEPRSENDSDTTTTCVDEACWSRHRGASPATAATSP